jgi:hypothetical protein
MKRKKSKYKFAVIDKKKYYFYKIIWFDILGDSGHATIKEFDEMKPTYKKYTFYKDRKLNSARYS